jgi:mono/diheme cytochrome c family protein
MPLIGSTGLWRPLLLLLPAAASVVNNKAAVVAVVDVAGDVVVIPAAVLAACSACHGDGSGVAVRSSSQGGRCFEVVVESAT